MRVYIAGAMTGKFKYKEAFKRAEGRIKELGHIALNPSFLPEGLADYFEINKAMIDQCDAIYVLSGYEESVGTKKELEYVKSKGWSKEAGNIIYEEDDYLGNIGKVTYKGEDNWGWVWNRGYPYRDPYNPNYWGSNYWAHRY